MKFTLIIFLIYRLVIAKKRPEIIARHSFFLEPLESSYFEPETKHSGDDKQSWNISTLPNSGLKLHCNINIPKTYKCMQSSLTVLVNGIGKTFCGKRVARVSYESSNVFVLYRKQKHDPPLPHAFHCKVNSKIMSKSGPVLHRPPRTSWSIQPIDDSSYGISPGKLKTSCACGWRNKKVRYYKNTLGRVIGGEHYEINEYPFIVQLYNSSSSIPFCAGTIITPDRVITAWHCVQEYYNEPWSLEVAAGSYDNSKRSPPSLQLTKARMIIVHKEARQTIYGIRHDIAILVMKKPFTFNMAVGPVCFPGPESEFTGQRVRILGWGAKAHKAGMISKPQKVDVMVIDKLSCSYEWGEVSYSNPTNLCTQANNKTSCQGDSGGPVIWVDPDTNRFVLVGIISYGKDCMHHIPSVHTDVIAYENWILQWLDATGVCRKITRT